MARGKLRSYRAVLVKVYKDGQKFRAWMDIEAVSITAARVKAMREVKRNQSIGIMCKLDSLSRR